MDLKIKAVSPKIGREIPYPYYRRGGHGPVCLRG